MQTSWYSKVEGRQHWVGVFTEPLRLEHSSDPVSELVGGGYFEVINPDSDYLKQEIQNLSQYFGAEEVIEILALARTLTQITPQDYENKTLQFYSIYESEINILNREKGLFKK